LDPASSYEEVDAAIEAAAEKANDVEATDLEKLKMDFRRRKQAYDKKSKNMYSKALGGHQDGKAKTPAKTGDSSVKEAETENSSSEPPTEPQTMEEAVVDNDTFSWSNWRSWPWSSIGAYAFQLSMPFVMYVVAMNARKNIGLEQQEDAFRTGPVTDTIPVHEEF